MASVKPDVYADADAGDPLHPHTDHADEVKTADGLRTKLRALLDRAREADPPPPTADGVSPRVHADLRGRDPRRSRVDPRGAHNHHETANAYSPRGYEDVRDYYNHRHEERGGYYADHDSHHRREDAQYSYYEDRDPHYQPRADVKYSHLDPRSRADEAYAPYPSPHHLQDVRADRKLYENFDDRRPYSCQRDPRVPYTDQWDNHLRPHSSAPQDYDCYPHRDGGVGGGLLPTPSQMCTCPTHGPSAPQWTSSVPAAAPSALYQSGLPVSILGDGDRHDAVIYVDHRSPAPDTRQNPHHHLSHYLHSTPHPIVITPRTSSSSSNGSSAAAASSPEGRHLPYDADFRDDRRPTRRPTNDYNHRHKLKQSSAYDEDDDDEDDRRARMRITVANDADDADDAEDLRALLTPKVNGHAPPRSNKRSAASSSPSSPTASLSIRTTHPNSKKRPKTTPTALPVESKPVATLAEYEDDELFSDFAHMAHVLIPSNASAALLERRGAFIQAISQQSQCTLSIRDRFEDVQGDADELRDELTDMRLLRIYGRPSGISLALRLAIERIREFRAQKRDPYYAPMTSELMVPLPDASITRATVQWMGMRGASTATTEAEEDALELVPVSEDDDTVVQLRWLVQTDNVGRMMGPKGAILAGIRRDTGAAIHVAMTAEMGPGATERVVTIEGTRESVLAAHAAVQARAGGRAEPRIGSASKMGQYFAIPYHTAGFLIGLRGGRARAITAKTGARLQIPSQLGLPLGSVNRIVHVQGTRKQIEHAVRVVSAKLRDFLAGDADLGDVSAGADDPTRRQDEYDGEEEEEEADVANGEDEDPVTIRALVTTRVAAKLLDARGRLVREIMRKSGAYLRFLKSAPRTRNAGDKSRVCLVSGDMPHVLRAVRLVLQVAASDAQVKPQSTHNVPRMGKRKREEDEQEEEAMDGEEEAMDGEEEDEQALLDENHELPTKRSRPRTTPSASSTHSCSRPTSNATRRPMSSNGNGVARQRRVGGGGGRRKVQVVSDSARSRRPALSVRKS